ncbi:RNA polymerase sigma factor [Solihabitans fulvus]|uniref:RNA polymerase sigma factor n=1 Tax=Solihabitans fulvus TaxID=1892852 RepID=UPI00166206A3|nr:RNA polymerase sigma factor [Solihabitans fulvus]
MAGGDELVSLYDTHARPLHRYLAARVGSQLADDLVADAFLAMWAQRDRFDPERGNAKSLLYGVATKLASNHARAEERRLRAWTRSGARDLPIAAPDERLTESLDAGVLAGRLSPELAALKAEQRDVLLLVAWADPSVTEAAEALDIPVATARTRLHRARTRLKTFIQAREGSNA